MKPSKSKEKELKVYHAFEIKRAKAFENGGVSFDMVVDGWITIYNCTVVAGKGGDFISFPSRKGSDGKYYNYVYFDVREYQDEILEKVQAKLDE